MKSNYFVNITNIEELKHQYFVLAKKYHSDITGGSDDIMKEINAEYSALFKIYKDIHKSIKEDSAEEVYTASTPTNEAAEDFIGIIKFLLGLGGLEVELCGRWLWISGNTKEHKELLKTAGCKWSQNKKMWSWHYNGDGTGYRRKGTSIDSIRATYGSISYKTNEEQLLLA